VARDRHDELDTPLWLFQQPRRALPRALAIHAIVLALNEEMDKEHAARVRELLGNEGARSDLPRSEGSHPR